MFTVGQLSILVKHIYIQLDYQASDNISDKW